MLSDLPRHTTPSRLTAVPGAVQNLPPAWYPSAPSAAPLPLLLLLLLIWVAGCGRNEITTYTVVKDAPPPAAAPAHAGRETAAARPRPQLAWTLPKGWQELGPGQMSLASFSIPAADGSATQVSITQLGRLSGRDVEIVNMWRDQLGLDPVSREEAEKQFQPVTVGGEPGNLFELNGTPKNSSEPSRIVTAVVHRADGSWFFKLAGKADGVAGNKAGFVEFLKSVRIKDAPADAGAGGGPGADTAAGGNAADPGSKRGWQVPAGWSELPAGQMQVAKFSVPGQGEKKAEVFVSVFPGDTGGTLANVNRWRRQLGLPEMQEGDLGSVVSALGSGNPQAKLVDLTNNNRRLIGAIVPRGGSYWFYKMLGDTEAVTPQKDAFMQFAQSAP